MQEMNPSDHMAPLPAEGSSAEGAKTDPGYKRIRRLAAGNAVVVFTASCCCMCHVPAVFVAGKFLGGLEAIVACHINGTLVPLLKDGAGALWL